MGKFYALNGDILPADEVKLHVTDLSILRGYSIFDFFRTSQGKPLFMDDHINRFNNSCRSFGLDHKLSAYSIKSQVEKLIALNGYAESGIKMVMTGGYSPNGFEPAAPNFIMMVDELTILPETYYKNGVKVLSHQYVREYPEVKSTNYLTAILNHKRCKEAGAIETLYHDGSRISELTRSNLFVIRNKKLITPINDILKGITRQKVLQLAQPHYELEEGEVSLREVYDADEAFMTSSIKRVLPVVGVDKATIGSGQPGPVTMHLMQLFKDYEKKVVTV